MPRINAAKRLASVPSTRAAPATQRSGRDPGLCASKDDGRVSIPSNFRVDACWDGAKLVIKNRTTVVLRIVTEGGLPTPVQGIREPPPLSSVFTAANYGRDIVPPQYTETITAGSGGGAVRIIFADENILKRHALAALIQEVLPVDSAVGAYAAFQSLVTGLDGAQARATQCLAGANAFRRVVCLSTLTRDSAYEFAIAGANLGIEAGKAVPKIVGRIWSIITVSNLVSNHFTDLATLVHGAERIDIAPATSGAESKTATPPTTRPSSPPAQPNTRTLVVDNRVTNGSVAMREDTPAYLSTVTRNFCRRDGCILQGTEVGSGANLVAECTVLGDRTTNGQDNSAIDDRNPGLFTTTRWYGIRWGDGRFGYISEAWIRADFRGGLGLRPC